MESTAQTARLEARISPDLHKMLKRAAELQGSSVSQFVVTAAQDARRRVAACFVALEDKLTPKTILPKQGAISASRWRRA